MLGERDFTLRPDQRPQLMMATLGTTSIAGKAVGRLALTVGPIVADAVEEAADAVVDDVRERRLRREFDRNREPTRTGAAAASPDSDGAAADDEAPMDADEIRTQFLDAFDGAREPVPGRLALWRALPDGLDTTFSSNGVTFTARELNERTDGKADFPYETVEALVDDLVAAMRERGHVA
jgi:hypothetical protein